MKAEAQGKVHEAHEKDEPCDPERLKVLEGAVREALQAYLTYTDPHNRVSQDEALGQLVEILDRREVAEAADVDLSELQLRAKDFALNAGQRIKDSVGSIRPGIEVRTRVSQPLSCRRSRDRRGR